MTFKDLFSKWGLTSIKLNIGFAEMEFSINEYDKIAAWDMYVELVTRIATQTLEEDSGDEETALTSIFNLFAITRDILKENGRQAGNFTKISIIILNQIIRPFTAKWHRKKNLGAFLNEEECKDFRQELEKLQKELRAYVGLLADMAEVEDLTEIIREN